MMTSAFEGLLSRFEAQTLPTDRDGMLLRRAFEEASKGIGRTAPNPPVGAVVVKDGQIISVGHHRRAGGPHAEVVALRRAGSQAKGACLYVTLEPCAHHGKTPPCTDRIIEAELARVVVGAIDPNPQVNQRGVRKLRRAGVEVKIAKGSQAAKCRSLIAPFSQALLQGRPYLVQKVAASLDGKVATATGHSRWITSPQARRLVHQLRHRVDAVLVGAGTVLVDNPALTVRQGVRAPSHPRRLVVDGGLRTEPGAIVYAQHDRDRGKPLVLHHQGASASRRKTFDKAGIERLEIAQTSDGHVDLEAALTTMVGLDVCSVLVEPGPSLSATLMRQNLVDELWWFTAPVVIGADGKSAVDTLEVSKMDQAVRMNDGRSFMVGQDALLMSRRSE